MARIPMVNREQLRPDDRQYYDQIVGSRGALIGPYIPLLYSPKLAAHVADTGAFVRFESAIPQGLKEVVVLTTAREINSQFEFSSHAAFAREAGISEETIGAIASGKASEGLSEDEGLLVRYTQELLRDRKISDATFNRVQERLGLQGTVELTVLIGHYLLVGHVMAAFQVELAPGMTPELPV